MAVETEDPRGRLIRIEAPHFVAGVEVEIRAAPIVRYMASWSLKRIRAYCRRKGWKVIVLS